MDPIVRFPPAVGQTDVKAGDVFLCFEATRTLTCIRINTENDFPDHALVLNVHQFAPDSEPPHVRRFNLIELHHLAQNFAALCGELVVEPIGDPRELTLTATPSVGDLLIGEDCVVVGYWPAGYRGCSLRGRFRKDVAGYRVFSNWSMKLCTSNALGHPVLMEIASSAPSTLEEAVVGSMKR